MGRFASLTPVQDKVLRELVGYARQVGFERFATINAHSTGAQVMAIGASPATRRLALSCGIPPWEALADGGFLLDLGGLSIGGHTVALLQAAYDYVDYPTRGLRRFVLETAWDMGHDTGLRARLIWMAVTLVISSAIACWINRLPHP